MKKHLAKGLYYIFDEKYSPRNKCTKHKLFMASFEFIIDYEVDGGN
jgi:hypothetical protein